MDRKPVIPIENRLDKPHIGANKKLGKILDAYIKKQGRHKPYLDHNQSFYWDAEHYHLHTSTLFQQASAEQKRRILEKCSQNLISESYFVEKSAAAYCGKMMLLAETTEIAQTYSMIANEEAIHLQWITPFIHEGARHCPQGFFLKFLSSLIEECDAHLLPYLVQIILEGWGLHHYKNLARQCLNGDLRDIFLSIVRDEALHHHAGEVIFDAHKTTDSQHVTIEECLKTFCEMVRVGPVDVIGAVEEELGGLNHAEKKQLFDEIDGFTSTLKKLNLLKELMLQPGMEKTVQRLEDQHFFTPLVN